MAGKGAIIGTFADGTPEHFTKKDQLDRGFQNKNKICAHIFESMEPLARCAPDGSNRAANISPV